MLKPNEQFLFTRQRHDAKRAGLHYDYRFVIGPVAYSFATRKEMPEPGKMIVLFQQPVHTREYALSKEIEIPEGSYGAGKTTLDFVHKATVSEDSTPDDVKMHLANGQRFLLKKMPGKYGEKAWLFRNITSDIEKKAFDMAEYVRHKYKEESSDHLENPVTSIKYDGAHVYVPIDEKGNMQYFSRRESVKGGFPEKTEKVPHLVKTLPQYANTMLATELIHTGKDKDNVESHRILSGILNSLPPRAIETQKEVGPVRAVLLDVKHPDIKTFREKIEFLKNFEKDFGDSNLVFSPEFVYGHEAKKALLEKAIAEKREGIITTDLDLPENKNPRYKDKIKQMYNLRVLGFQQEMDIHGNPKPSMGALILADATGRIVGKVGTGFDRNTRISMWENQDKFKNSLVQVLCMPPTKPGGMLRHTVYNGSADGDVDEVKY